MTEIVVLKIERFQHDQSSIASELRTSAWSLQQMRLLNDVRVSGLTTKTNLSATTKLLSTSEQNFPLLAQKSNDLVVTTENVRQGIESSYRKQLFVRELGEPIRGMYAIAYLDGLVDKAELGDFVFVTHLDHDRGSYNSSSLTMSSFVDNTRHNFFASGTSYGLKCVVLDESLGEPIASTYFSGFNRLNRIESGGPLLTSPVKTFADLDHAGVEFLLSDSIAKHVSSVKIVVNDFIVYQANRKALNIAFNSPTELRNLKLPAELQHRVLRLAVMTGRREELDFAHLEPEVEEPLRYAPSHQNEFFDFSDPHGWLTHDKRDFGKW